jgi:hypothetical protein
MPNEQLRVLLKEAGWTGTTLVRKVNELGAETGLALGYQRASATQWLYGCQLSQRCRHRGAIGGQSAGSVTTRTGDPARYAATSCAMRCQAVRNRCSVT